MNRKLIKIGFRCDAGEEIGLGHIMRCIALAAELKERGAVCWFYGSDLATRLAVRAGFPVVTRTLAAECWTPAAAWVVDLQRGCPPSVAEHYRELCDGLVIMNGVGWDTEDPARLLADLVFYQGCASRPYELDWDGFGGAWYEGAEWVILRPEFKALRRLRLLPEDRAPRIVTTGGGADKGGVTVKVVEALAGQGYELRAIVGPAAPIFRQQWAPGGVEVLDNPRNYAEALAWADVAVISYGMSAFECLCLGMPVVAFCTTPEQEEGAALVSQRSRGALVDLSELHATVKMILTTSLDGPRRSTRRQLGHVPRSAGRMVLDALPTLSQRALDFVDGEGAGRVADKIMGAVND